ncbi:AHH domain-containing protein [Aneurinibacillus sp. XH2]|uniref:AHH domain-containing protein n=1 Tax=Aneurinibacillus sp. XH2 TaxID=1450761 RepID=UPI0009E807D8|nr:AHH domain-containing protein [Aneurinibacillus sp. XH2]
MKSCLLDFPKGTPKAKPEQVHHYATNKSKKYTPQIEAITKKYGLDLDEAWNKELLPHQGRHPDDDIMCYCEETYGIEQYQLKEGKLFKSWNERITFYYDPNEGERQTDYLANNLGWFVVSSKLKRVLDSLEKGNIQYFPVRIIDKCTNEPLEGYFVANIINVVDALCLEHSKDSVFELDGEKIYSVQKYALTKENVAGNHIIKLKGDEIPVFVSEKFREEIEKNGIIGCDFQEVKVV